MTGEEKAGRVNASEIFVCSVISRFAGGMFQRGIGQAVAKRQAPIGEAAVGRTPPPRSKEGTHPGRASCVRNTETGEHGGEEYARNRRCYVPQSFTGSNLADRGRMRCALVHVGGELRGWSDPAARGGHGKGLRRTHGDTAGTRSGSSSVERISVNTGTVWDLACRRAASVAGWAGRTDRRSVRDGAESP
jgi:hypothetical protein